MNRDSKILFGKGEYYNSLMARGFWEPESGINLGNMLKRVIGIKGY